jgi:hypothetical protein
MRCWLSRPQLGGYLNPSKSRTRYASRISFSRLDRRASALRSNQAMQPQMDTDKHR